MKTDEKGRLNIERLYSYPSNVRSELIAEEIKNSRNRYYFTNMNESEKELERKHMKRLLNLRGNDSR